MINIRLAVWTSLAAALIIVGAFITIPLSPVPIVLTNLFVIFAGLMLAPQWACAALLIYLTLGAFGLPIFAGGGGGLAHLFGPTGGYLFGFLGAALVAALIVRPQLNSHSIIHDAAVDYCVRYPHYINLNSHPITRDGAAAACATIVIYLCGIPWLMWRANLPLATAIAVGFYPFILFDSIKAVLAISLARAIRTTHFSPYR